MGELSVALVIEDDCESIRPADFESHLVQVLEALDDAVSAHQWDLVLLAEHGMARRDLDVHVPRPDESWPELYQICMGEGEEFFGTFAMLWSLQGARRALELFRCDGVIDQIDAQLSKWAVAGKLRIFKSDPH